VLNTGGDLKETMNTYIFGPCVGFDSAQKIVVPFPTLIVDSDDMFNLFHTIGVIAISTLFSAAVSWTNDVLFNNTSQRTHAVLAQSSAPKFSLPPTTVVVVYYPTSDNPSYTVVVGSSVSGAQTYYVAPPQIIP